MLQNLLASLFGAQNQFPPAPAGPSGPLPEMAGAAPSQDVHPVDIMMAGGGSPQPQQQMAGGFGLQSLFDPQGAQRNQTVQWLQTQGLDQGTATLLAGNKGALQQYLLQRSQGEDPMKALELEKLQIEVENLRNPQEQMTDDIREFQFAKQNGYGGSFEEWQNQSASTPAGIQEYEYAVRQGFPGTFQDWEASKRGGMSLQVDPATGQVTFQQGQNIKPMTEAQSKDTVFATRAQGALPLIDQYGDALTQFDENLGARVPLIGNYIKSDEYQQAEQAGREFLQAILRKDTGAAITPQEMIDYGTVYLPMPGDRPAVLAQKQQSRQRALEAIKAGMPPQAIVNQERALLAGGQQGEAEQPPAGVDADLWRFMTPEEKALFQ